MAGALESAERGVRQLLELNKKAAQKGKEKEAADLVKEFMIRWKPDFGVDPMLLIKQLQISKTLQVAEFPRAQEVGA